MTTTTQQIDLLTLANEGYEINLSNIKSKRIRDINTGWQDFDYTLTDSDISAISELLGGWQRTQNIVANKLRCLSSLPSNWCFERIYFCKHSKCWRYCAGQDYPAELAIIRKWFTNL